MIPNPSKIWLISFQDPPKTLPKPSPNRPKIDPGGLLEAILGLLEPILDQCFKKTRFLTPKKQPKGLQERPREAPDRPRPSQNEAQEPPKSDFSAIFGDLFRDCKFVATFNVFF